MIYCFREACLFVAQSLLQSTEPRVTSTFTILCINHCGQFVGVCSWKSSMISDFPFTMSITTRLEQNTPSTHMHLPLLFVLTSNSLTDRFFSPLLFLFLSLQICGGLIDDNDASPATFWYLRSKIFNSRCFYSSGKPIEYCEDWLYAKLYKSLIWCSGRKWCKLTHCRSTLSHCMDESSIEHLYSNQRSAVRSQSFKNWCCGTPLFFFFALSTNWLALHACVTAWNVRLQSLILMHPFVLQDV